MPDGRLSYTRHVDGVGASEVSRFAAISPDSDGHVVSRTNEVMEIHTYVQGVQLNLIEEV
jgi:hypothetical protein